MDIHEKTKERFAISLKKCMEKSSIDHITVTQIVEGSKLTRQTFYRYFKDKYDLVNWYFEKLVMQSFRQMGVSLTLREALIGKFEFIASEHLFFKQAFLSQDYNSLMAYDYRCILAFYKEIICKNEGSTLNQEIMYLLEMYC